MTNDHFTISFDYPPDNLHGMADIQADMEDGQTVYLAKNIRFDNSAEELTGSHLLIEEEMKLKKQTDQGTDEDAETPSDRQVWVDADTEEESELASLIGAAIENYAL